MPQERPEGLDALFDPRNIVVIGASADIRKWGNIIPGNIIGNGFKGHIYLVNPSGDFVHGIQVHGSVGEIDDELDLAMLAVPAQRVEGALRECGERGVKAAIVITAGYSEAGPAGAEEEKRLVELARGYGMKLVGPNTMGIFSGPSSLSALMPPVRPRPGAIAFGSQSGNLGTQMLGWGSYRNIGFSRFVCIGNESDIGFTEYLDYFHRDPATRVILFYVEGMKDPRGFLERARGVARDKPIVVYKAGGSGAGTRAAASHSAALAGDEEVYQGFLNQLGVIKAQTTDEMLDFSDALVKMPVPAGNRVGILTWGGGWGVVTADLCERSGLDVAELPEETRREMDELLPSYWSRNNPVDLVGLFDIEAHMRCLELMVSCDAFDSVISLGSINANAWMKQMLEREWSSMTEAERDAAVQRIDSLSGVFIAKVAELIETHGKPVITVGMPQRSEDAKEMPGAARLCLYMQPESAVRVTAMLWRRAAYLKGLA